MQDSKNNGRQADRPNGGQSEREAHPFDRSFRHRLAEAEVRPPAGLTDKLFEALEEEESKREPKVQPVAPTPVRRIGGRLSRIAAIAGIAVALAIGIQQLTGPLTGPQSVGTPAERLTAVQSPLTPKTVAPVGKQRTEHQKAIKILDGKTVQAAGETLSVKGRAGKKATTGADAAAVWDKGAVVLSAPVDSHMGARTEGKTMAMTRPSTENQHNRTAGKYANKQAAQKPDQTRQEAGQIAITKVPVRKPALDPDPVPLLPAHPKEKTVALSGAGQPADRENTAVAGSHPQNAIAAAALTGEGAVQEDKHHVTLVQGAKVNKQQKPDRVRRSGLLKGLFKKIGNTARAITEEVVSGDEDKTVINVGVLAITAYK